MLTVVVLLSLSASPYTEARRHADASVSMALASLKVRDSQPAPTPPEPPRPPEPEQPAAPVYRIVPCQAIQQPVYYHAPPVVYYQQWSQPVYYPPVQAFQQACPGGFCPLR